MNLEHILQFVTHNSQSIIQWLVLGILVLSAILIGRGLLGRKDDTGPAATAGETGASQVALSAEVNSVLQKILEQTAKLEAVPLAQASPASVAQVDQQVQTLKRELESREAEIAKLKAGGDAAPAAEAAGLSVRIKELEAKLAEYEILEDDIADLSLYKEENSRLKQELEKFKAGGAVPAPSAEEPAPASAEAVAAAAPLTADDDPVGALLAQAEAESKAAEAEAKSPAGDDIVAEFAQAVGQETAAAEPLDGAATEIPETGNPMADFENAVKLERKMNEPATPTQTAAVKPAPAPTPAAQPAPADAQAEADDLFAEFSQDQSGAGGSAGGGEAASGSLDTEKMMEEMAALVSMEPSEDNSLEEGIDTDKMALEATGFKQS